MRLHSIKPAAGSRRAAKRVGRGIGSTLGKTCGRGHKGQKSRSGGGPRIGFEGGQMPLQLRLPKFGFSSRKAPYAGEISLRNLEKFPADTVVNIDNLKMAGLVRGSLKTVKIIGNEKLSKKYTVEGLSCTQAALAAIQAAGGTVEGVGA